MRYCQNCGAPCEDGSRFCPNCGESLKMIQSADNNDRQYGEWQQNVGNQGQSSNSRQAHGMTEIPGKRHAIAATILGIIGVTIGAEFSPVMYVTLVLYHRLESEVVIFLVGGFICSIIAVVAARNAIKKKYVGGLVIAGRILGILGAALAAFGGGLWFQQYMTFYVF